MSDSKTRFSMEDDDINFQVDSSASQKSSSTDAPAKPAANTATNGSTAQNTDASSKASLRAKLLSAAQNAAPAYTPSVAAAAIPAFVPSNTAVAANTTSTSAHQQQSSSTSQDDFDPNNFELSNSGDYPSSADAYEYDDYQGPPTDSESYNFDEDDDHTRDLCSNPCTQCGTVPSYVVYELCADCLDKVGPQ